MLSMQDDNIQTRPVFKQLGEHTAMDGRSFTQSVGFDYEATDRGNPLEAELSEASSRDKQKEFSEVFKRVLQWCWLEANGRRRSIKFASVRFATMTSLIAPDIFDGLSYEDIGSMVNMSKSNVSLMATDFEKCFGFRAARSRPRRNKG